MSGGEWLSGTPLFMMLGLVALTMAVIWIMPRITRVIPAPLATTTFAGEDAPNALIGPELLRVLFADTAEQAHYDDPRLFARIASPLLSNESASLGLADIDDRSAAIDADPPLLRLVADYARDCEDWEIAQALERRLPATN